MKNLNPTYKKCHVKWVNPTDQIYFVTKIDRHLQIDIDVIHVCTKHMSHLLSYRCLKKKSMTKLVHLLDSRQFIDEYCFGNVRKRSN